MDTTSPALNTPRATVIMTGINAATDDWAAKAWAVIAPNRALRAEMKALAADVIAEHPNEDLRPDYELVDLILDDGALPRFKQRESPVITGVCTGRPTAAFKLDAENKPIRDADGNKVPEKFKRIAFMLTLSAQGHKPAPKPDAE